MTYSKRRNRQARIKKLNNSEHRFFKYERKAGGIKTNKKTGVGYKTTGQGYASRGFKKWLSS